MVIIMKTDVNSYGHKPVLKSFNIFAFTLLASFMLFGCGSGGKSGAGGAIKEKGTDFRVSPEIAGEADEFKSKVKIKKAVGDFELTTEKLCGSDSDFLLHVRNRNGFPAGAMVTCVLKDADEKVITAASQDTAVLVDGAEDIIGFTFEDTIRSGGFDTVELTAYAKEKSPNTVRMIDRFDSSKVKVTAGKKVKGGRYDGWNEVDVTVNASESAIGDAVVLFYDADGYLLNYSPIWTNGKEFSTYNKDDFDHCEVLVDKLVENVPALPDSIYNEYRSSGFESKTDGETKYTSPDGSVEYSFLKTSDGQILIHAVNLTSNRLDWFINEAIVYSGDRKAGAEHLHFEPGEELLWNPGFEKDSVFWLMAPVAYVNREKALTPPAVEIIESDGAKIFTVDAGDTMNHPDFEDYNTLDCRATVVYYLGTDIAGSECIHFNEDMLYHQKHDEAELTFDGSYDSEKIYVQYEQRFHMVEGY
ncbi:hypothetical protein UYO_1064 [Lachnospiraceae bacterium JC7]|nr:hypothetical protein UYO_1064 [Lachnospiraceae bacterium JC7]